MVYHERMRSVPILEDSYYHVYNRGDKKQVLFLCKADYVRFLYLLLYFQSPVVISQTNRAVSHFLKHDFFKVQPADLKEILDTRTVEVLNFCKMPNHFHITIHNLTQNGISKYMHRVSNAYAKYFNTKYEKTGHVFQGAYKAKIIDTDEQLMYLSAYIHRNPSEISLWKHDSIKYPWSSYRDYDNNRWGKLLDPSMIMNTYRSFSEYDKYVCASGAKDLNVLHSV